MFTTALVGVLSTGLLHQQLVRRSPTRVERVALRACVHGLAGRQVARGAAGCEEGAS